MYAEHSALTQGIFNCFMNGPSPGRGDDFIWYSAPENDPIPFSGFAIAGRFVLNEVRGDCMVFVHDGQMKHAILAEVGTTSADSVIAYFKDGNEEKTTNMTDPTDPKASMEEIIAFAVGVVSEYDIEELSGELVSDEELEERRIAAEDAWEEHEKFVDAFDRALFALDGNSKDRALIDGFWECDYTDYEVWEMTGCEHDNEDYDAQVFMDIAGDGPWEAVMRFSYPYSEKVMGRTTIDGTSKERAQKFSDWCHDMTDLVPGAVREEMDEDDWY